MTEIVAFIQGMCDLMREIAEDWRKTRQFPSVHPGSLRHHLHCWWTGRDPAEDFRSIMRVKKQIVFRQGGFLMYGDVRVYRDGTVKLPDGRTGRVADPFAADPLATLVMEPKGHPLEHIFIQRGLPSDLRTTESDADRPAANRAEQADVILTPDQIDAISEVVAAQVSAQVKKLVRREVDRVLREQRR